MSFDVYVVFTNDDGNWWSRFLHKEIKHCFVIKPDQSHYIVYSKTTEKFDLFTSWNKDDILDEPFIMCGYKQQQPIHSLLMLNTCVGHAKQLLGINNMFILTPYQLYKHLSKQKRQEDEKTKGSKANC